MGSRYRNESDPKDSPTAQRQAGILKGAKEHEPVGQLPPQPWWQSPEVKRLFQALTPEDQPALAPRFVGGSVRDALIGAGKAGDGISAVIADLDVATPLEPDQSCAALEAAGIRWIGTGLSHGTVTAVVDGQTFEVTSLRRDVACDGRHADVEFTRSWREDASRRDFTVNALSADGQGWVYDYFDGIADLHARHIRFIGRASDRIQEDYLRILRFFRFHARLGIGYPNGEGMAACAQLRDGLDSLSIERVRTEILKLLAAPDPVPSLLAMRDAGVLERVLPEGETVPLLRMVVFLEDRGVMAEGVGPDPLRRLGALVGCGAVDRSTADQTNLVEQLSRRWKLSRAEQARLSALAGVPPRPDMSQADLAVMLDGAGPQAVLDRLLLAWAADRDSEKRSSAQETEAWRSLLDRVLAWDPPPFPLDGAAVMSLGLAPGPEVGRVLARAKDHWLRAGMGLDRAALLAWVKDQQDPG